MTRCIPSRDTIRKFIYGCAGSATASFVTSRHAVFAYPTNYLIDLAVRVGMPLATEAAIACPGCKVISLQADGSGMYTLQALWTQAREALDVTTLYSPTGPMPASRASSSMWARSIRARRRATCWISGARSSAG